MPAVTCRRGYVDEDLVLASMVTFMPAMTHTDDDFIPMPVATYAGDDLYLR
jgi:hypothetical protein